MTKMREKLSMYGLKFSAEDGLYLQIELADAFKRIASTLDVATLKREQTLVSRSSEWELEWLCETVGLVREFTSQLQ